MTQKKQVLCGLQVLFLLFNCQTPVEELALEAEIEKVEDLIEIVKLGVMSAPSIMIDGKVVISGQVPTKEKIKKILERVML